MLHNVNAEYLNMNYLNVPFYKLLILPEFLQQQQILSFNHLIKSLSKYSHLEGDSGTQGRTDLSCGPGKFPYTRATSRPSGV